jgi:hypothetical protein
VLDANDEVKGMTRRIQKTIATIAVLFLVSAATWGQGLTAFQVVDRVRDNWQGNSFHCTVSLDVTQSGTTRSYKVEVWSQGDEMGLIRFLAPEADAGSGYLTLGDEMWYYAPAAGKAISLPGIAVADSLFGGGPAVEDLLHGTLSDKYAASYVRDGTDYLVTLTPLPDSPVVYGSLIVRVREDFALLEIVYNDQRGEVVRTARFTDYVTQGERTLPTLLTIEERNGDVTVERLENPEFGIEIPLSVFTIENLEAGL